MGRRVFDGGVSAFVVGSGGMQQPLPQVKLAVAERGQRGIVGDRDKRASILAGETEQEVDDPASRGGIQIPGRLVGEEDAGVVDQRAGDRHALLLPAAQLGGEMVETARQTDPAEKVTGLGLVPRPAQHGREQDVLEGR